MRDTTWKTGLMTLRYRWMARIAAAALLAGASATAWARFEPPAPCRNGFTREQEISEGAKVAAQVYQQMPVLPESDPISRYVAELGAHLASHAPGGSAAWPYSFHVVASADINAFALPGGSMFVNLGTVQAAETEAQLAGVMSHELSHVILRHATCNITKQQNKGLLYGVGALASELLLGNGTAGRTAVGLINGVQGLDYLHMSRDDEKQADLLGTGTLYDSGYDPRGLPQFFETIEAKYGSGGVQMLSDHPNPGNRTQYVSAEIATLPQRSNPMITSAAFTRVHSLAKGVTTFTAEQIKGGSWKNSNYATGPGQGATRYPANAGNVSEQDGHPTQNAGGQNGPLYGNRGQQSSNGQSGVAALSVSALQLGGRMTTYSGNGYTVGYPGRWTATAGQNGAVSLAPAGGAGTFGMAYGAMIETAKVDGNGISDADSLSNATTQLLQKLRQQNGGLEQIGQIQTLTIGGQGANAMELRGQSPVIDGGRALQEHDWLVTVARPDGDLSYMIFVSPERDFGRLRPTFIAMMNSFRPIAAR